MKKNERDVDIWMGAECGEVGMKRREGNDGRKGGKKRNI